MRDYPNGGFFFIDAAPIIAAGESGVKIDGIFEDAKRAFEAGKVFVVTGVTILGTAMSSCTATAYQGDDGIVISKQGEITFEIDIAENDTAVFTID